jgi:hypothetical protein
MGECKRSALCPGARASLPALLGGRAILGPVMDEPWFPKSLKTDRSLKRHEAARGVLRPSPFAAKDARAPRRVNAYGGMSIPDGYIASTVQAEILLYFKVTNIDSGIY